MRYTVNSIDELSRIAKDIINKYPDIRVFLLEGNLGAGKTTFTKAFGKALNIEGHISSPTFSIVNEYQGEIPLYHFDLYRIKGEDELFQIGFEEYFRRPGYKLIEWPEVAMNLIDEGYVILKFEVTGEVERQISVLLPE